MEKALQIFTYNGESIKAVDIDGVPYFVGKDIATVLGYSNTNDALIRHVDEEDKLTSRITMAGQGRDVIVINESGIYALIFASKLPEAKKFKHWVTHEVLPAIRRTGSYSVSSTITPEELELKRNALDLERAKLINSMIEYPSFPMTPETKTVFAHEVFKLATGHSYLAMLPESTERWYTAGEIGAELGLSANKVGRIAKANGIKAPAGESNEYGRWIFSKSQHSSREVSSFIYSEAGLEWFRDYQNWEKEFQQGETA